MVCVLREKFDLLRETLCPPSRESPSAEDVLERSHVGAAAGGGRGGTEFFCLGEGETVFGFGGTAIDIGNPTGEGVCAVHLLSRRRTEGVGGGRRASAEDGGGGRRTQSTWTDGGGCFEFEYTVNMDGRGNVI